MSFDLPRLEPNITKRLVISIVLCICVAVLLLPAYEYLFPTTAATTSIPRLAFKRLTQQQLPRNLLSKTASGLPLPPRAAVIKMDSAAISSTTTTTTTTNPPIPEPHPQQTRTPVYFISHGGPNIVYSASHPAYARLSSIGHEITHSVRPKAIVVISAHWQATTPGTIEVAVPSSSSSDNSKGEELIYDFYGFPRHYYAAKFPHKTSHTLARRVISLLREGGIDAQPAVGRGLDHGVWAPFKVAFDPERGDGLGDIPVCQVSLWTDERDGGAHLRLGRALAGLREEGVLVMGSGMAVHNLRDLGWGGKMAYTAAFDEGLREAVEGGEDERGEGEGSEKLREGRVLALLKRGDVRRAHPTLEHLMPVFVAVGAAGGDRGRRLWTLAEGSMSWAQYRFGEVGA